MRGPKCVAHEQPPELCGRRFGGLVYLSAAALLISSRAVHGKSARLPTGNAGVAAIIALAIVLGKSISTNYARRSTNMVLSSCCIAANPLISSRHAAVSASGASACRPRKNSPNRPNPYSRFARSRDSLSPSV